MGDIWWSTIAEANGDADAATPEFAEPFSRGAAVDRRSVLKLMAAVAAMSTAACSRPPSGQIVPYVTMPERIVPGIPLEFATALILDGYAQPVIVESHEGRPTKVEGNPQHPMSRGATDAFAQAALLSLYDPERNQAIARGDEIGDWGMLAKAISDRMPRWRANGSGLRILSGCVTSPTLAAAVDAVLKAYPGARWHRWQPVNADTIRQGAEIAFGRRLEPRYRTDAAAAIVSLDCDFLGPGPFQVSHARAFGDRRRARNGTRELLRLLTAEAALSLTGAQADVRLACAARQIPALAAALAVKLGAPLPMPQLSPEADAFAETAAAELRAAGKRALVCVGHTQAADVHALAHWINERLGSAGHTVQMIEPVEIDPVDHRRSLGELAADIHAGRVDTLLMIGGNPAYDAPGDVHFVDALGKVPFSIRLGLYNDETSRASRWHVPMLHPLEGWSDAAATDGTPSIVQPLVTPLYRGYSAEDLLAALADAPDVSAYDRVRDAWRTRLSSGDFEATWRQAVHDGLWPDIRAAPVAAAGAKLPNPAPAAPPSPPRGDFEVVFTPDPSVWDGSFAGNAWLQELPRPFTKLTWNNAAHLAPADASTLGLVDGDMIVVTAGVEKIEIPVVVSAGQARRTVSIGIGYGHRVGGAGQAIGVDVGPLRSLASPWRVEGAHVARTGARTELATTQPHRTMAGRDIVRTASLAELAGERPVQESRHASMFPNDPRPDPDEAYAWGMVIDQTVCIGCNACVTACQAENNNAVVGPEEIRRGRDMHWLRVDVYYRGEPDDPAVAFQPVPCMHCEKAPCEPVCPVEASVHDSEGLNVQVYNRCVGTRFCQSNCPWKVRRFNWFGYNAGQEYGNLGDPRFEAVHNPDVTVRARGVMEKCTYCVQRISRARRTAEKEDRNIRDGEVTTACQQACPTSAISFGNLKDPRSAVAALRSEPHHYAMMGELGTKPRTTYLARVRDKGKSA